MSGCVGVAVGVGVLVGEGVGVLVGSAVLVGLGVAVGSGIGVDVGPGSGVRVESEMAMTCGVAGGRTDSSANWSWLQALTNRRISNRIAQRASS